MNVFYRKYRPDIDHLRDREYFTICKRKVYFTFFSLLLQTMTDEMFTRKHGSRPGVAHICILITDGRSSQPDLTEKMAEEAHDSGVYLFAIGTYVHIF